MKKQLLMILAFFGSFIIQGQIINIPENYSTIQEGIEAANEGDTVLVEIGTYYENLDFEGKNITLASTFILSGDESVIEETVIDGGQNWSVVSFNNGEDSTASLIGFTITNGEAHYGGGIYCKSYNTIRGPNLENLIITGNTAVAYINSGCGGGVYSKGVNLQMTDVQISSNFAGFGAGAFFENSSPVILGSLVTNNQATESGGGIYCENTLLYLNDVAIEYNQGGKGGGISLINSNFEFEDITVEYNHAGSGGGFYLNSDNGGSITFNDFSFSNNSGGSGGALYSHNVSLVLNNIICKDNESDGSAIYLKDCEDITISNSSFNNNAGWFTCLNIEGCNHVLIENSRISNADYLTPGLMWAQNSNIELKGVVMFNSQINSEWGRGAAIFGRELDLKIINCTFADISSYYYGEVISLAGVSNCEIVNSVFDSLCSERVLVAPDNYFLDAYLTASVSHSNLHPDQVWANELDWQSGNIHKDPEFILIGPHPYQIIESSPCADAGTNDTTGLSLPEFDCANNPRINNQRVDMGAYEWDITVSDNEIVLDKKNINTELLVFPNPFKSKFIVEFEMEKHGDATLKLYDGKGVMIKQKLLLGLSKGKQTEELDLPNLEAGVYIIKINYQNKVLSHKILKTD